MAIIKKSLFPLDLEAYTVLIEDTQPFSRYFNVTELPDTLTGGKNSFLIQGSEQLVADTLIKIEVKDSKGNVIYHTPVEGKPEYYEGTSKPIAIYIYPDTAFGPATITILGELGEYFENGRMVDVPENWKGTYNVRWQKKVNINPLLANESKVRFYRRPKVDIQEDVLPIYVRSTETRTISGSLNGKAIDPVDGDDYGNFRGVLKYELSLNGNNTFSQSLEGVTFEVNGLNSVYTPIIVDVLTDKKALASIPYYETSTIYPTYQEIKSFTSASYTASYISNEVLASSAISSSFARIKITDLETFSGDPKRIKVYASSKSDLGNAQLLQDFSLESNELLIVDEYNSKLNVRTGLFSLPSLINDYWVTQSLDTTVVASIDNTTLFQSVKLVPATDSADSTGLFKFYNKDLIDFNKNTEYQLDFTPLLNSSVYGRGILEIYMSGSAFVNNTASSYGKRIGSVSGTTFGRFEKQVLNFQPDSTGTGNILFLVKGGTWQISNISLAAAQESAFSPNEVSLVVNVPTKIPNETFDFKFELYDINNNYIPVNIAKEYTFQGGNDLLINKDLNITLSNPAFSFSGSVVIPNSITIDFEKTGLSGSVTFASSAYDSTGNIIPTQANYPGLLQTVDFNTKLLSVANFTGSLASKVSAIAYTASCDDINRYFTVFRIESGATGADGINAYLFYSIADKNNFTFDPDDNNKSVLASDYIDVRLVKQNLGSGGTGLTITSSSLSGSAAPLYYTSSVGITDVYRLYVSSSETPSGKVGATYPMTQSLYNFSYNTTFGTFTSSISINMMQKGANGKGLVATADTNQFYYKMTDATAYPTSQTSTLYVKRQNLGTLTSAITIVSSSGNPFLTVGSTSNGVTTYTLSTVGTTATNYTASAMTYTFTSKDLNNFAYSDQITIQPLIIQAPINVTLSNDSAALPARSTGFVDPTAFILTSGSVSVRVGSETIVRQEGLATNNRWDIISATGTSCTPNSTTPPDSTYGITAITSDSASLDLVIRYKDGIGTTTDITKTVTYTRARGAVPNIPVIATPNTQAVTCDLNGVPQGSIQSVIVTAMEGNISRLKSVTVSGSSAATFGPVTYTIVPPYTMSATIPVTNITNVESLPLYISASYIDSEGTAGTGSVIATIAKSKTGSTGQSAKSIALAASSYVITYDEYNFENPNRSLALTASLQNNDPSITYVEFLKDGVSKQNTLIASPATFATYSIAQADEPTSTGINNWSVKLREGSVGSTVLASDIITLYGVKAGSNGYTVICTNEAATLPANADGTISSYAGSGTSIIVYKGATQLDSSGSAASGSFTVVASGSGITPANPPVSSSLEAVYGNASNMTADSASITYTINLEGLATVTKKQLFGKSKTGQQGDIGPGIVFRGQWNPLITYQYNVGTSRRDSVMYTGSYYIALSSSVDNLNKNPGTNQGTFWQALGTASFFVAAEIAIFTESYVKNTLNVGTNAAGSDANITIFGSGSNPYISIGQGVDGFAKSGIFLGYTGSAAKFSLSGSSGSLQWDGSALTITGSVNATSGKIGGWTIASNQLTSQGNNISLDGTTNTIKMVVGGLERFSLNTGSVLPDPAIDAGISDVTIGSSQSQSASPVLYDTLGWVDTDYAANWGGGLPSVDGIMEVTLDSDVFNVYGQAFEQGQFISYRLNLIVTDDNGDTYTLANGPTITARGGRRWDAYNTGSEVRFYPYAEKRSYPSKTKLTAVIDTDTWMNTYGWVSPFTIAIQAEIISQRQPPIAHGVTMITVGTGSSYNGYIVCADHAANQIRIFYDASYSTTATWDLWYNPVLNKNADGPGYPGIGGSASGIGIISASAGNYYGGTSVETDRYSAPYSAIISSSAAGTSYLYVADKDNGQITRRSLNVSSAGTQYVSGVYPLGMAVSSSGDIYFCNGAGSRKVYRMTTRGATGVLTTFAGAGTAGYLDNVVGASAQMSVPAGIAISSSGDIFITDIGNHNIRKISRTGSNSCTTFAGGYNTGAGNTLGTGTAARFNYPQGIAISSSGEILVCDTNNHCIKKISRSGVVTLFAGSSVGAYGNTGGSLLNARFYLPQGIAIVGNNYYVSQGGPESANGEGGGIRYINGLTGQVTTGNSMIKWPEQWATGLKFVTSGIGLNINDVTSTTTINAGGFISIVNAGKYLRLSNSTTDAVNIAGGLKWDLVEGYPGYTARAYCTAVWTSRNDNYSAASIPVAKNVIGVERQGVGKTNITFGNRLPTGIVYPTYPSSLFSGSSTILGTKASDADTLGAVFASAIYKYDGYIAGFESEQSGTIRWPMICSPDQNLEGGFGVKVHTFDPVNLTMGTWPGPASGEYFGWKANPNILNVVVFA